MTCIDSEKTVDHAFGGLVISCKSVFASWPVKPILGQVPVQFGITCSVLLFCHVSPWLLVSCGPVWNRAWLVRGILGFGRGSFGVGLCLWCLVNLETPSWHFPKRYGLWDTSGLNFV